jgi:hypothetical protein
MNKLDKKIYILDAFGLISIGIFSLGYVMHKRAFAELHIQLSFLNFPIFVGEILLFLCLIAFFLKSAMRLPKLNKWHGILFCYFGFVVFKALYGYWKWDALALRDAALLYYPVFAVLGYSFYRKDFFDLKKRLILPLVMVAVFISGLYDRYWLMTFFSLAFCLIYSYPNRTVQYVLSAAFLVFFPIRLVFYTARMMILGNTISILYVITCLYFVLNLSQKVKTVLLVCAVCFLILGIYKLSNSYLVRSIVGFQKMGEIIRAYDAQIAKKLPNFKQEELGNPKIYNPGQSELLEREPQEVNSVLRVVAKKNAGGEVKAENALQEGSIKKESIKKESIAVDIPVVGVKTWHKDKEQALAEAQYATYSNSVFRLLIWRDMFREFLKEKPILGLDFGKPLRSISIEVLGLARNEWRRDGWIAAHNSYLHVIYRTGIVGVLLIGTLFIQLFRMVKEFMRRKSVIGILLSAAIINWLVATNFLLIWELPYTAIPFWSIVGITFAYFHDLCGRPRML